MVNIKKIQSLKEKYIEEKAKIRLEPQTAIAVHIDFEYLLNSDLYWILGEIRSAIKDEIISRNERKKRFILTFSIDQVSTKHSIDIIITPGLIDPYLIDIFRDIGVGVLTYLIIRGYERLRQKGLSKRMRPNLRQIEMKKVTYYPDGRIEYSESEEDEFTIE